MKGPCCLPVILLAWSSMAAGCANSAAATARPEKVVHVMVVAAMDRTAEIACFGSITYGTRLDVVAPQDATVAKMLCREGEEVVEGAAIALLANAQIALAVGVAQNAVAQAESAVRLAEARLVEGEQAVESRILGLDKARLAIDQARCELAESQRKQIDQEALRDAGGVNDEAVRSGRFAIDAAAQRITLMEKELEMQRIGLRDEDLVTAGMMPAIEQSARRLQLVRLAVRGLVAERDGAIARLDAARKELASAALSLAELRVVSPMGGIVGARYTEQGQRVKRDEALYTLIDGGPLFATATVPESEAALLASGMKATITVDAIDGVFAGVVDTVSPLADARSASCTVRIALADTGRGLKPGMFARVGIQCGETVRSIVVPARALAEHDGDAGKLFVVVDQRLAERRVRLGALVDGGWIASQGLDSGDVVVDIPDATMKAGDHVSISAP